MSEHFKRPGFIPFACGAIALSIAMVESAGSAQTDAAAPPPMLNHAISADPTYLDQGAKWTPDRRLAFYSQDQGSQLIPLAWLRALTTVAGEPFLADQLARYGYLPNPDSPDRLPVGFTVSNWGGEPQAGMTCAACHTRQIRAEGEEYRVDGGPALVDFQRLLSDLIEAVGRVRSDDAAFTSFAQAVLGAGSRDEAQLTALRQALDLWYERENTLRQGAYAEPGLWGLGRLDAVSMIFNRLVGLDIGAAPDYILAENIQPADAPTRYPFLWNASIQDKTQWPGFADNGSDTLALARNTGEVIGVFGTFHPVKHPLRPSGVSFADSSVDFSGLRLLEDLIKTIGPPKYPWPVDSALAARGKALYQRDCAECHGIEKGKTRFPFNATWRTPVMDVGTDTREYAVLDRTVADAGALTGAYIPFLTKPIPASGAKAFDILGFSVIGSLLQGGIFSSAHSAMLVAAEPKAGEMTSAHVAELKGAFPARADAPASSTCDPQPTDPGKIFCYESRVMQGIWAAAPYLHNGSVPTLADLLRPSSQRPQRFAIGRSYDIRRLGLAVDQPGSSYFIETTDCSERDSGNSRCGHEGPGYGTDLSEADRQALLEYLKML